MTKSGSFFPPNHMERCYSPCDGEVRPTRLPHFSWLPFYATADEIEV